MGVRITRKSEGEKVPTQVVEMVPAPVVDGPIPEVRLEPRPEPKTPASAPASASERKYETKYPAIVDKLFKDGDTCARLYGLTDNTFLKAAELILALELRIKELETPPWEDVDAQIAENKKLLYGE